MVFYSLSSIGRINKQLQSELDDLFIWDATKIIINSRYTNVISASCLNSFFCIK